jgi:hypothetical protein
VTPEGLLPVTPEGLLPVPPEGLLPAVPNVHRVSVISVVRSGESGRPRLLAWLEHGRAKPRRTWWGLVPNSYGWLPIVRTVDRGGGTARMVG